MDQNDHTTLAEEIDTQIERPTKRHRYDKDADLQGRPLPEIIFALREAASYYLREVDSIPDLTRGGGTIYIDVDEALEAIYVWEKHYVKRAIITEIEKEEEIITMEEEMLQHPQNSHEQNLALRERIAPWTDQDSKIIEPLKKRITTAAWNQQVKSTDGEYVGTKYYMPFSIRWNKHQRDDIFLAESLVGATTSHMTEVLRNYDEYARYIDNNKKWKTLLNKILADQISLNPNNINVQKLRNNPAITFLTFSSVRDQANNILKHVNNVETKMSTLYSLISRNDEASVEDRNEEAQRIITEFNRDIDASNGRSGASDSIGGLDCEYVYNGRILQPEPGQHENDVALARAFNNNKKTTYMERVRLLNSYLSQHLRFVFKTSALPLYIEKVPIDFSDRWKGVIRDSMVRYTTHVNYKNVIQSYRDLFLIEHNEPMIALFAEFVSKRADNTQVTMRPQTNHFTLTHYQLDRNKIQYKAKERELDKLIATNFDKIKRAKRLLL